MGPHLPCGSILKGKSTMLALINAPMTMSPSIMLASLSGLLPHVYFLGLNFWRCLSVVAVGDKITLSRRSNKEAVGRLCAMVMSALIVVYGQGVWTLSMVVGSGSKDTSKGCAVISDVLMFFFSISKLDKEQMYFAVDRAGRKANAHESCMILCAIFLLISLQ
jgi:hypothetical protein